jgi:uncharacterized RDD family membrane protein YckC
MKNDFYYQTSEKIRVKYSLAGLEFRIAAYMIDTLIMGAAFILLYILTIITFVGSAVLPFFKKSHADTVVAVVIWILFVLGALFYPFIFELAWKGQTPGKRILKIRAVNDDGTSMSLGTVILRNIFRIVDMLPASYITGVICMVVNKKRKRVGDMVAGTIVISEKNPSLPRAIDEPAGDPFAGVETDLKGELKLIENYISTRDDLSAPARDQVEEELVRLIQKKTGVEKQTGMREAEFIQSFYRHLTK